MISKIHLATIIEGLRKSIVDEGKIFTPDEWAAGMAKAAPAIEAWNNQSAATPPPATPPPATPAPPVPPVGRPGTVLKAMLASWGTPMKPGCGCEGKATAMDKLGVAGCRENFWTWVGIMKDGAPKWGWAEKLKTGAGMAAADPKLAARVLKAWPEIWPVIIGEAIDRAERGAVIGGPDEIESPGDAGAHEQPPAIAA